MIKRVFRKCCLTIVMTLCLILLLPEKGVQADDVLKIGIDQAYTSPECLYVYINHNKGDDFEVSVDNSELTIDEVAYEIEGIERFGDSGEAVSYLFLVDISGSMDAERIEDIRGILRQFVAGMGSQDNICITTMGNDISSTGFLYDAVELNEWIDQIVMDPKEDTNLYYGIVEALDLLSKDQSVTYKRCLVIFSDGDDDQATGITREEAEIAVLKSHIPVFTVALIKPDAGESDRENAKILGSFARYSAGGRDYTPSLEDYGIEEIYDSVENIINSGLIITLDLAQVNVADKTVKLAASLSDGVIKADDSVEIFVRSGEAKEVLESTSEPTLESTPEPAREQTPEPTLEPEEETGMPVTLIAGGIVLLIAAVILVVFLLGKRKTCQEEESGDQEKLTEAAEGSDMVPIEKTITSESTEVLRISLCAIGSNEEAVYTIKLEGKATIGRGRKCQLSIREDMGLSEIHCELSQKNGKVCVRDMNSTNGTFLNGIPVVNSTILEKDDILLIGSHEYRVSWE